MSSLPLMSTSYSSSSSSDESLQKPADVLNLGQSLSFAIKEKTLHIQGVWMQRVPEKRPSR